MDESKQFSAGFEPAVSDLHHTTNTPQAGFYLADIQVLPNDGHLLVAGEYRHISAKAMQLLLVLAANAQQVVARPALLQAVTGSQHGTKETVSNLISELRHAMGDHRVSPTYIETLTRRGYRLLQPVRQQPQAADNILQTLPSTKWSWLYALVKGSRLFRVSVAFLVGVWLFLQVMAIIFPLLHITEHGMKLTLLSIVVIFPLVLLGTWLQDLKIQRVYLARSANPRARMFWQRQLKVDLGFMLLSFIAVAILGGSLKHSIDSEVLPVHAPDSTIHAAVPLLEHAVAVLPFHQDGASSVLADDYVIDGIRDELLYSLSQLNAFPVISARAMQGLPDNADNSLIIERLGAQYVVEGKLKTDATELQLEVMVIQLNNGVRLWSTRLQAPRQQLPQLQQQLYRQLTNAFGLLLQNQQLQPAEYALTESFQAYDAYLQANMLLKQFANMASLDTAERLFLQALDYDPKFAMASAGLCKLHLEKYAINRSVDEFELARQACEHAASFSSNQAQHFTVIGDLYRTRGELEQALSHYNQALQLNPAWLDAITGKALLLADLKQPLQAEQLFKEVIRLEPGYWQNYSNYGRFLYNNGQFSSASKQLERAALIQPDSVDLQNSLGASYFLNNDFAAAIAAWQKVVATSPLSLAYSNLGTAYYFNGEFSQAEQMYLAALHTSKDDYTIITNLADSLDVQAGRQQEAQAYYQQALLLAQANLAVNQDAKALLSQIIRIQSELGHCGLVQQRLSQLLSSVIDDFYIYYDLAIASFNCSQPTTGSKLLQKAIAGGYSAALIAADPKIPANTPYL
jgi:tetratricopeptide (TPR) repeat protein/DNA-binding winged helix-turn-helix (wHTH) protein